MTNEDDDSRYILIVEDSPEDYQITLRALRKAGMKTPVHHCEDGDCALDFLEQNALRPSLILLDLNLPGTDGREALSIIKTNPALKKIPVVILSNSNNEIDVETCYEVGANAYIQKPTDHDEFIAVVKSINTYWFKYTTLPAQAA